MALQLSTRPHCLLRFLKSYSTALTHHGVRCRGYFSSPPTPLLPLEDTGSFPDPKRESEDAELINEASKSNKSNAPNLKNDYSHYFSKVVSTLGQGQKVFVPDDLTAELSVNQVKDENEIDTGSPGVSLKSLAMLEPKPVSKSASLLPYVNESETLQKLVQLNVDLSKFDKEYNSDIADHVLKCDFDVDIKPRIFFLLDVGVPKEYLGVTINKNADILLNDLDDMGVRINYLKSKKFSDEAIARIVTIFPGILNKPTKELDAFLGFLQKEFKLSGNEVRKVLTGYPMIAGTSPYRIKDFDLSFDRIMGFSVSQRKHLLVNFAKVFSKEIKEVIIARFDYLHNTMGIDHATITNFPKILSYRVSRIRPRYLFLKHLSRDQFDKTKPLYVSLEALASAPDSEFCFNVAKVPVAEFNDFLKTL